MITRSGFEAFTMPALVHNARFHSCTVTGFTCYSKMAGVDTGLGAGTTEFMPGLVIDRLGLPRNFGALLIAPVVYGDFQASEGAAGDVFAGTFSAGLQHTSASGGTFASYSTGDWLMGQGLWRQTTATCDDNRIPTDSSLAYQRTVGFTCEIGVGGLTSTTTSTADGQSNVAGTSSTSLFYYAGPGPVFNLTGAKRYIRVVMRTQFETTGCGSGGYHMSAGAIFLEPDEAQPPLPGRRILVTSACAT